jgi:hypothetical protein
MYMYKKNMSIKLMYLTVKNLSLNSSSGNQRILRHFNIFCRYFDINVNKCSNAIVEMPTDL